MHLFKCFFLKMVVKPVCTPRTVAFHIETNCRITYSRHFILKINEVTGIKFHSVIKLMSRPTHVNEGA